MEVLLEAALIEPLGGVLGIGGGVRFIDGAFRTALGAVEGGVLGRGGGGPFGLGFAAVGEFAELDDVSRLLVRVEVCSVTSVLG